MLLSIGIWLDIPILVYLCECLIASVSPWGNKAVHYLHSVHNNIKEGFYPSHYFPT